MKKSTKKTTKKVGKKVINKRKHKLTGFFLLAILMIIAMLVIYFGFKKLFQNHVSKASVPIDQVECLQKDHTCDRKDIRDGIKVKVAVNNVLTYDFYVISDTTDTITLLYADNLAVLSNWSNEMINFKGPQEALYKMNKKIESWNYIPYIKDYVYSDYGYLYYQSVCITNEEDYDSYDCSMSPGYRSISVVDGKAEIDYHLPLTDEKIQDLNMTLDDMKGNVHGLPLRGRMITFEEVVGLGSSDGFPSWLIEHLDKGEFYWTMSSSSMPSDYYVVAAYGVYNDKGTASLVPRYVMNQQMNSKLDSPTGHLRPVITISKK